MNLFSLAQLISSDHPEQEDDEIFVGNIRNESDLKNYQWKTKRLGTQAYDCAEKPIGGFPVFIKRSEVDGIPLTSREIALLNIAIQPVINTQK